MSNGDTNRVHIKNQQDKGIGTNPVSSRPTRGRDCQKEGCRRVDTKNWQGVSSMQYAG